MSIRKCLLFFGRGNIRRCTLFIILLITYLFMNFGSVYSDDVTADNKNLNETEYFNKIKSTMEKENPPLLNKDKGSDKQKTIKINYFSYIKIILVLGLAIMVIYGLSLLLKRTLNIKGNTNESTEIIISQSLGPGKWIQVVYLAGKFLVLGVTNDQVNLLTEITDKTEIERFEIIMNQSKIESGGGFIDVITDFFKNKISRPLSKKKFDYEEDSVDFLKKQKERIDKMNKG